VFGAPWVHLLGLSARDPARRFLDIVPILSTPIAVQLECTLGDAALGQHWRDRYRGR
jgi:hypothetical protein